MSAREHVCACIWCKGGALNRGPSSPDLKRHSFIIANLPNINMRASTQSLSLRAKRGDPPMTGDEGLHECRAVRASVCRTVCFRGRCSHCINQHIRFITVVCEQILRAFLRTCALLGESDSKPRETVSSTKPCRT